MDLAARITAVLLKAQQQGLRRDDGYGCLSARDIAQRLGLETKPTRAALRELADAGTIRRVDCINGLFWRSVNPLPWEPGGRWPGDAERELQAIQRRRAELVNELATLDARAATLSTENA